MAERELHRLIANAVVSDQFRAELLNGHRAEVIRQFHLEPYETVRVMAIKATTFPDFAAEIENIIHLQKVAHRLRQQNQQHSDRDTSELAVHRRVNADHSETKN